MRQTGRGITPLTGNLYSVTHISAGPSKHLSISQALHTGCRIAGCIQGYQADLEDSIPGIYFGLVLAVDLPGLSVFFEEI